MYLATKHTQTINNKPLWQQSSQQASKSKTHLAKPTCTALGQPTNSLNKICKRANQPHSAKPQGTKDDYPMPYAQWWPS